MSSTVDMKNLYMGASTMEAMFKTFISRLDQLASKVDALTEENKKKESLDDAMRRYGQVMSKLGFFEERLGLIEKALTVKLPNGQVQTFSRLGNTVSRLVKELDETVERVNLKAEKVAVKNMERRFEETIQHQNETVARERASAAAVLSLETSHRGICMQVGALQTMLGGKVDKSEVEGMQATLQQLNDFASFRSNSLDRIAQVEADFKNASYALSQQVSITTDLAREVNGNKFDIEQRPLKTDVSSSLRILREELNDMTTSMQRDYKKLVNDSTQSLERSLGQEQGVLKRLLTSNTARLSVCNETLTTMGTKKELSTKASERSLKLLEDKVDAGLKAAASYKEINMLRGRTGALESHFERLAKHTEVMHRFIKWYHDKGATYDHNNGVIERQLGNLVRVADPRNRSPFDRNTLVEDQTP
jgi:hypothetical protein|eukprot:g8778.t1